MTKEELELYLKEFNISDVNKLETLASETLKANELFNLTAIKDINDFRELMIYDSLLPLKYFSFDNKNIIDIGTGAGFPGLPLAISTKGKFTLLDSTSKKINHINEVSKKLDLSNVKAISARAEEYARKHINEYDYAIARAVSSLPILIELAIPLLKVGGYLIAMKSNKSEEEIALSKRALKELNAEIIDVYNDQLPISKENRTLIVIKKIKSSPKKYPRSYSEIKSKTL